MAKLLDNEYSMISFKTYKNSKSNTFLKYLAKRSFITRNSRKWFEGVCINSDK